jgi:HEAT repeat protein
LGFVASSDPFVGVAAAFAVVSFGMVVGVVLEILVLRRRGAGRERARDRFVAAWRPLLFDVAVGGAPAIPQLPARDEESFLLLWIQLQDGLAGEARSRFTALARTLGARRMALQRVEGKSALGRILALRTLGYLGDPADYGAVARHLDEPRPYLCVAAARALVDIDPVRAPDDLVPRLAERTDWPIPLFAMVLRGADLTRLPRMLADLMMQRLPPERLVRMLALVSLLEREPAEALLRYLLARDREPEVLCAALERIDGPALAPLVRRHCAHASWTVRTQAAAALGRVGTAADRYVLLRMLCDREWWVRYRAAQGLCSGRFGRAEEIRGLVAELDDRFAHDIVEHALAEGRR